MSGCGVLADEGDSGVGFAGSCAGIVARDVTVRGRDVGGGARALIGGVRFAIPAGTLCCVVGASGCGKSTLLKAAAGVTAPDEGRVEVAGHEVGGLRRAFPNAVAYLPQFGAFHGELAVGEILELAVALRLPPSVGAGVRRDWLDHVVGLSGIRDVLGQRYRTLSGGQMRRVSLAEALVGDPAFLFLDELTSGLDEFSDGEMMRWLRDLAHVHGKTVVLVTHSTYHLDLGDSVMLLDRGRLVFHGGYRALLGAFGATGMGEVFAGCAKGGGAPGLVAPASDSDGGRGDDLSRRQSDGEGGRSSVAAGAARDARGGLKTGRGPSGWLQFPALMGRQVKLFLRDRGGLWMHLALVVTFPALVAVFATKGLPEVRQLTLELETNVVRTLHEQLLYLKESFGAASLLSGVAMFQVILLTLAGANNGAREIAKERDVLDKELRAGLSPGAYVGSKLVQVVALSAVQAFWMAWFVKTVCGFPGLFRDQFAILFMTVLAMGATCLAISAGSRTAERASLLSIYLVGFQLPLSGAALSLPDWLNGICRPLIAAYWGWSGYLQTLHDTRHFDVVKQASKTAIAPYGWAVGVLALHVAVAVGVAWWAVGRESGRKKRWG